MANGNLFGDIKSRLGLGGQLPADEAYDEYDEYDDEYGYEDEYEDDYIEEEDADVLIREPRGDRSDRYGRSSYEPSRDPYMDRGRVTTRSSRVGATEFPRLVSMDDARESARNIPAMPAMPATQERARRTSSVRSYGRTMVDSSLPSSMTAEGASAIAEASNRRAGGLNSLFGGSVSPARNDAAPKKDNFHFDSLQASIPGQRQLQVLRPASYEDAEAVTKVLKGGDAAIIIFRNTDRALMMRILDFSFGAASALDAGVECIASGVFAICRNSGLSESERADLRSQGIG